MLNLLHRTLLGLAFFVGMSAPAHAARTPKPAPAKTGKKPVAKKSAAERPVKSTAKKLVKSEKSEKPARTTGKKTVRVTKSSKARAAAVARAEAPRRRVAKGTMTLRNLNTRDKLEGLRVVEVAKKGKKDLARLSPKGKKKLAWMLRDFRNGQIRQPPDRLLYQLYQVQQHFDAPVEIVSGYRHWARPTSRHFKGWAVDFKVEGVDPKTVWAYCKQFKDVGCGHYPTSQFVHMDVRDKSYSWIDMSGPGERARYVNSVTQPESKDTGPAAQEE